jgi:hypothetical protein
MAESARGKTGYPVCPEVNYASPFLKTKLCPALCCSFSC